MDSRLQRVGGGRLSSLLYSDAPKVAQAILDAMVGRARVLSGVSHDTSYIEFVRDQNYVVVVRADDWRKIFPFVRYATNSYTPVEPPPNQPPPIPSPQPNRVMQPPPVNPAGGIQSFLAGFPFDQYSKLQRLLTTMSLRTWGRPTLNYIPGATYLNPPETLLDAPTVEAEVYKLLVQVLQQLFPNDFPTTY